MKSTIFVNELNCYGRYVSALDRDNAFSEKDNPEGLFKTVVEPVSTFGRYELRYVKDGNGYWVQGEGYIITGRSEAEIDADIRKNHRYEFELIKMTEDKTLLTKRGKGSKTVKRGAEALREFLCKNIANGDMDEFLEFVDKISKGDGRVSDSVIEDWGNAHPDSNPWRALDRLSAVNTPCEGCRHVGFRYDWEPCATCVRNPSVRATDNYKPEE